jgi:hypothetical protein
MSRQRIRQKFDLEIPLLSLAVLSDRARAGQPTIIAPFDGIDATSPTNGAVLDAQSAPRRGLPLSPRGCLEVDPVRPPVGGGSPPHAGTETVCATSINLGEFTREYVA